MKKLLLVLVLCLSLFANTGCAFVLLSAIFTASDRVTDPNEYGDFHRSVDVPSYYPDSISGYTVNDYCYVIEKDARLCYEIYLDLTLDKADFDKLLSDVSADSRNKTVKGAYHSSDYMDVIFHDDYELSYDSYGIVDSAHIEKVIYNEEESRIIFSLLYIEKESYYYTDSIEAFKKPNIDPEKYATRKTNEF